MRITIFDKQAEKVCSVPVDTGSTYYWKLMEEEYLSINFQSQTVLPLKKGQWCYVDDRLGRFEIVEQPRPERATSADGYDYALRLDRPWAKFKNRIYFFKRGTVGGMEAKWSLTDTLEHHAAVLLDNLNSLGFEYNGSPYEVAISEAIPQETSKLVPFDKTSILDAMTAIAKAFECEWWIDGKTIHFGKCETGEEITLEVDKELKAPLTRQDDSTERHGTRLYAFGSTRNLNDNYRRELNNPFTIGWSQRIYSNKIRFTLAAPGTGTGMNPHLTKWWSSHFMIKLNFAPFIGKVFKFTIAGGGEYTGEGDYGGQYWCRWQNNPVFEIDLGGYATSQIRATPGSNSATFIIGDPTGDQPDSGASTWITSWEHEAIDVFSFADIKLQQKAVTSRSTLAKTSDGTEHTFEYVGTLYDKDHNPIHQGEELYRITDGTANPTANTKVTLAHLATAYVNRLYTTPIDGEADVAIQGIAQTALKMPAGVPYIDSEDNLDEDEVTEVIKQYDDIYPRALLTIEDVKEVDAQTVDEDTKNVTYWKAYRIKAKMQDGSPFNFDSEYIIPGDDKPLSVHFQSGKLNGMDFEVKFNPEKDSSDTRTFEIVRNDTYTLELPNENAKPEVGDTLYMYNMDVTFIDETLIGAAEREVEARARKDIEELRKDDGTYTGNTDPVLCEAKKIDLSYGQRVKLVAPEYFSSKDNHSRSSRIIAFSKNLEDLYDAEYTIGESAAYSQLGSLADELEETVYYNGQIRNSNDRTISIDLYNRKIADLQQQVNQLRSTLDTKLSRTEQDKAKEQINFAKGITLGEYVSGKFGSGGQIDLNGHGELASLTLREFLEVPELRYNRVNIQVGNSWRAPGGGIVYSVVPDTDSQGNELATGIITLHLEDGEIGTIAVDDICQGIYHDGMSFENNAEADYDDSIGNFKFAGFYTCYFRIVEILEEGQRSVFRYALRPTSERWPHSLHPKPAMHFVAYGNFTDKERQTSRYSTRTYERYLKDVDNWEFTKTMIGAQFGDLTNLDAFGYDMKGYSAYLNNIYMSGTIQEMDELPIRIECTDTGDGFLGFGESCVLEFRVKQGWKDITDTVTSWSITRDSADPPNDAAWNLSAKAQAFDGTITIAFTKQENDLGVNALVLSTIFYVEAKGETGTPIAQAHITF